MTGGFAALRTFWDDLKRRRLFRAGALYAVAAWALTEAASIVLPAFGDTGVVMRALIVAAFAGFPVVLVLAWVFDVSPAGIEVTQDSVGSGRPRRSRHWWVRPLIAAPVLAALVGGTVWLWTARLADTGESEFTRQMRTDELAVVAVLPLENLTGRKDLDWAGAGVATLVRDGLSQSRYLAVVSAAWTMRLTGQAPKIEDLFVAAADAGISHVLTGEILRTAKGLTITARLTDLRRNMEVGANRHESLTPEEVIGISPSITTLIKQSLGVPGTEKVDVFATDFATRNLAAYEAFVVGMQNFLAFDYTAARQLFAVAVDKAPDFAMARYRLAHALAALGDTASALEQIGAARKDGHRLSPREQAYIAAGGSYFARDYSAAERQYRDLLKDYPYESEARALLLYVLYGQRRYEEALVEAEALVSQDPGDETAWSSVADLNLKLGRYDAAVEPLDRLVLLAPLNPNTHFLVGDLHFFRQEFELAVPAYQKALELDPSFGEAIQRLAQIDVFRGRLAAAIARLRKIAEAVDTPPTHRTTAAIDAAQLLRADGRCREAEELLIALAPQFEAEKITEGLALSIRARCRLEASDLPEALRLAQAAVTGFPGRPTRYLLTRGLVEIEIGDRAAVEKTVRDIQALPARPDPEDRTEQKTVDYLAGLLALRERDAAAAVKRLQAAIEAKGRPFDVYELALARALAASGDQRAAREAARHAADRGKPADFDAEFETGRRQAAKLAAELG